MAEERSCKTCRRDCSFSTGYDHSPFNPHMTRVDSKTFVCVSWADDINAPVETEDILRRVRQPREK